MPGRPLPVSTFIYPDGPLSGQQGVAGAFAVGRPGRWLLFDSGIGLGNAEIEAVFQPGGTSLLRCLRARRIDPADISVIVNSHLHFDHCGQNKELSGIPILVQARELEAAQEVDYTVEAWVHFQGSNYRLISGDAVLEPGVSVVATPGHTPGHQSLLIDDGATSLLLAGQACYGPDEWAGTGSIIDGRDSAWDPTAYVRSRERLRDI